MPTHRCALRGALGPLHAQFDRGVVAVDHARQQQTLVHQQVQRLQQIRRLPQPVAQRGTRDGDAGAGQLPGQAVQRRVVGELGRDDVGQQSGAAQPLGDRPDLGRPGGLQPLLGGDRRRVAAPAGVALPDGAQHEEACRLQVELLGRLLTDADARLAAAGTELLGLGQVVYDVATLQVLGQGGTTVLVASGRRLVLAGPGPGLTLAAATEAVLQGRVQLAAQLGVLGAQPGQLGEHLPQQRLQRRHVVGQRRVGGQGGGVHA